ncbi:MAG: hypothetical protein ABL986_13910 [Vicinamibacterales bacterium]
MARYALRPQSTRKFVIFAQGRSGSTLLTSTLNAHPEIACKKEILGLPRLRPLTYIENEARKAAPRHFGFHVKCYQLAKWQRVRDLQPFLRQLDAHGWKIIYLLRENVFEQAVSNIYAEHVGQYHFLKDAGAARPTLPHVDPNSLLARMRDRMTFRSWEQSALLNLPHLALSYDRHLRYESAHARTFERIQEFLGVRREALPISLAKVVNRPLSEMIGNYREVAARVRQTEFAGLLEPA